MPHCIPSCFATGLGICGSVLFRNVTPANSEGNLYDETDCKMLMMRLTPSLSSFFEDLLKISSFNVHNYSNYAIFWSIKECTTGMVIWRSNTALQQTNYLFLISKSKVANYVTSLISGNSKVSIRFTLK